MRDIECLRCGAKMSNIGEKTFQLGQHGWFLGDLPHLLAGALRVSIYSCPDCGKIEFFTPEDAYTDGINQVTCPNCGQQHDMDYPKCPFCKYDYVHR